MPFSDKLSPEDREFLEKMNVEVGETHKEANVCNCPWCRFERGDLPHPTREDVKALEHWANKSLDRLPPLRSLDLATAIAGAIMSAAFAGYAVGIDHARRESSDGDVDRGL